MPLYEERKYEEKKVLVGFRLKLTFDESLKTKTSYIFVDVTKTPTIDLLLKSIEERFDVPHNSYLTVQNCNILHSESVYVLLDVISAEVNGPSTSTNEVLQTQSSSSQINNAISANDADVVSGQSTGPPKRPIQEGLLRTNTNLLENVKNAIIKECSESSRNYASDFNVESKKRKRKRKHSRRDEAQLDDQPSRSRHKKMPRWKISRISPDRSDTEDEGTSSRSPIKLHVYQTIPSPQQRQKQSSPYPVLQQKRPVQHNQQLIVEQGSSKSSVSQSSGEQNSSSRLEDTVIGYFWKGILEWKLCCSGGNFSTNAKTENIQCLVTVNEKDAKDNTIKLQKLPSKLNMILVPRELFKDIPLKETSALFHITPSESTELLSKTMNPQQICLVMYVENKTYQCICLELTNDKFILSALIPENSSRFHKAVSAVRQKRQMTLQRKDQDATSLPTGEPSVSSSGEMNQPQITTNPLNSQPNDVNCESAIAESNDFDHPSKTTD